MKVRASRDCTLSRTTKMGAAPVKERQHEVKTSSSLDLPSRSKEQALENNFDAETQTKKRRANSELKTAWADVINIAQTVKCTTPVDHLPLIAFRVPS